jgi:hypothetical protein
MPARSAVSARHVGALRQVLEAPARETCLCLEAVTALNKKVDPVRHAGRPLRWQMFRLAARSMSDLPGLKGADPGVLKISILRLGKLRARWRPELTLPNGWRDDGATRQTGRRRPGHVAKRPDRARALCGVGRSGRPCGVDTDTCRFPSARLTGSGLRENPAVIAIRDVVVRGNVVSLVLYPGGSRPR